MEGHMNRIAYVLIDFDNIDRSLRTNNPELENRLYRTITANNSYTEINLRFYGGWDYKKRLSGGAIGLLSDLYNYPHRINNTKLNAELVRSLAFEKNNLPFTFRRRNKNYVFNVDPTKICKNDSTCDLYLIYTILNNHNCCDKDIYSAFLFDEQKLIDTMISTDLLYLSTLKNVDLFLVSSDDDFIPIIRYLCYLGNSISIIHTHHPFSTKSEYKSGFHSQIFEKRL
jgi:hypothetical protein